MLKWTMTFPVLIARGNCRDQYFLIVLLRNWCFLAPFRQNMLGLAGFLGMDDFLESAAGWLDVTVNNHNSVGKVDQRCYRAEAHWSVCVVLFCPSGQAPCRPQFEELPRSPCCSLPVRENHHLNAETGTSCSRYCRVSFATSGSKRRGFC